MTHLSLQDYKLIHRALMLLSLVVDGPVSKKCVEIAQHFASEYRVSKMLKEDEEMEINNEKQ